MAITQAFKDTYWNRLRVERNIMHKELAEYFGVSVSTVGGWFSGQLMPNDLMIKRACELFDVEFATGKEEFRKAHALWKCERQRSGIKIQSGKKDKTSGVKITVDMTAPQFEEPSVDNLDIIKLLYGKLPYDLFMSVRSILKHQDGDVLELVYGKVSYKEFKQIQEALS